MKPTRQTFRWAAWLGWQLESNWTEPWLFVIYILLKPITSSLMLVCMYYAAHIATSGAVPREFLPYIYVSNACYGLVGAVMFGMSHVVISDREHYRMLKYIYVSPAAFQTYFLGRGVSAAFQALLGGLINLGAGMLFFSEVRDPIFHHALEWGWLLVYLVLGTILLVALGLILASVMLILTRQAMYLSEGIAGLMYLVCGVVFPLPVLPQWLQSVSLCLPPTYWLEGMRRCLIGVPAEGSSLADSPLVRWGHAELLLALSGSTIVLWVFAQWFFYWAERRAWRLGKIEEQTGL
jgi:ABC-2 type transport system permease protein